MDLLRRCDGGPRDVVVTLGERGLWGMSRTGEVRQYRAHDVPTVNAVGAGDSFLAMLVSRSLRATPSWKDWPPPARPAPWPAAGANPGSPAMTHHA